jgi:hypothetical protein
MKSVLALLAVTSILCAGSALAGTPVLGFEVGTSTLDEVKATLSKQTKVKDVGVNKWSNGPMLKTDGASYEIEGLNTVLYIFDEEKKLAGVVMNMRKARFASIYKVLAEKYKLQSEKRAFVGNQFAKFKSPNGSIELDAPHMSFEMEVRYLTSELVQKFSAQSEAEAEAKNKKEAEKF